MTYFYTFEELNRHACRFILSKWQSFTDLNGTICAIQIFNGLERERVERFANETFTEKRFVSFEKDFHAFVVG